MTLFDVPVVDGIRQIVGGHENVLHVNEVLTMHMGPDFILVNLSVEFIDEVDATAIEETISGLDQKIKQMFPEVRRVFIEAEARVQRGRDN